MDNVKYRSASAPTDLRYLMMPADDTTSEIKYEELMDQLEKLYKRYIIKYGEDLRSIGVV